MAAGTEAREGFVDHPGQFTPKLQRSPGGEDGAGAMPEIHGGTGADIVQGGELRRSGVRMRREKRGGVADAADYLETSEGDQTIEAVSVKVVDVSVMKNAAWRFGPAGVVEIRDADVNVTGFRKPSAEQDEALQGVWQMFEHVVQPDVIELRVRRERVDFASDHMKPKLLAAELGIAEIWLDAGDRPVEAGHQVEEFSAAASHVKNGPRIAEEIEMPDDVIARAREVADGVLEFRPEGPLVQFAVLHRVEAGKFLPRGDWVIMDETASATHHHVQRLAVAIS